MGGLLSGLFGVGGGIIMVPAMVFALGYSQKLAQGTTLFLLMMPVVALGVYKYHLSGNVNWKTALWMAPGFVVGVYLGSEIVTRIPDQLTIQQVVIHQPLKKFFGLLMVYAAYKLLTAR